MVFYQLPNGQLVDLLGRLSIVCCLLMVKKLIEISKKREKVTSDLVSKLGVANYLSTRATLVCLYGIFFDP